MIYECIQDLIRQAAGKFADIPAVKNDDRSVNFGELEAKAEKISRALRFLGASQGSVIGIFTGDSVEVIASILGALRVGGIFCPLDPAFPPGRLTTMVQSASPHYFITELRFLEKLKKLTAGAVSIPKIVLVDGGAGGGCDDTVVELSRRGKWEEAIVPASDLRPDAACSIYFTPGLTGRPKAVLGRLKGIDHFVKWEIETFNVGPGTRVSQLESPSFDGFLKDVFVPLCARGVVCAPASREIVLQPERLINWLDREGIEILHCIPSVLSSMLDRGLKSRRFETMKYVALTGEALAPADVKRWMDVFGERIQLVNLYGMAETTLSKLSHFITADDTERPSIPIGKSMKGAAALVVSDTGEPCDIGEAGEIYIRTPYCALGYFGDPELTKEVFVPNPFSDDLTDIVCKTGDYGRTLESGDLEFLGRKNRHLEPSAASERYQLLKEMMADPSRRLSESPSMTEGERERLLAASYGMRADYPLRQTIHALFERQAERTPNATAVVCGQQRLSYSELSRRSNQLARRLRELGVRAGVKVGICLEHSIETVVGLLGILKAGGAYVPLEPGHPVSRLRFVMRDAELSVIVSQQGLEGRLAGQGVRTVCLDAEREWIDQASDGRLEEEASADDVAYVIYTSGSTGTPKGVQIQHRALVNYSCWANEVYTRGERMSFALYSSLAFDLTVTSIYPPLISGNTIVAYGSERKEEALEPILREGRTEVLKLTPSHLELIKERDNRGSGIRCLIVGGEALRSELAREVKESFGGEVEIYNEYGPTEATVGCAVWRYEEERRGEVPIGRPGANMQVYVLDECKQPVGEQVLGEIYIGGEGLALGYLKRDELTSEKFQEHPFEVGGRVYRTGDIGRWLPGGVLDYIGRRDEQVKYHGYRVELNEIRSALNEHSEVRESVVVMEREDGEPGVLVGYYVSRRELEAGALREFLRERLIEETIPSLFVHLKRMPLTLNGKVNVKALPSVKTARERARLSYEPPRTVVEEILAGIFGGVLKLERVGIRDNFFEFGGHSLLAIQVISQVREKFGVEIGVRNVFEAATVESLSRSVEEAMRAGKKTVAPPLVRADREGGERRAPLSFAQQRLWFLDQLEPGNPFYNILGALELEGRLDLEALEQAINEIVRRHEALRTRFEADNGEPTQVIGAWEATKVEVVNLTGLAPEARAAQARRIARDEAAMGFDLARGLLLRVKALKLEEERHLLLYTMHHIVSDGWSMNILSREVGALYQAYSADSRGKEGQTPVLPEMEIQYADFAVWQRKYLTEGGDQGILASEVRYWKAQLEDAAVLELPTDHPRPMIQSHRGAMERVEIDIEVSEGLRKLSQREGATLFMTLMAAFKILLMRYSGVEDVGVGTVIANRTRREVEGLIGFFVNTLVLRTDIAGNPRFRELVRREREVALGAYAHQEVPFEKLVEEINPDRDLSRSPLFQVMMVLESAKQEEPEIRGLKVRAIGEESAGETGIWDWEETGTAKFDLSLSLIEKKTGIAGALEYSTDLYEAETIRRMARHYERTVAEAVRDAWQRGREIELMRDEEKRQILEQWNETEKAYEETRSVPEMIEEQAARSPEAVAVADGLEQLTYRQLNERANRLARYLRGLGVGPEVIVGLYMERSVEMIVGLLGILKAGGAYLPMDPNYPRERLEFMLRDAGVKVLVSGKAPFNGLAGGEAVRNVSLEEENDLIEQESGANLSWAALAESLAYVIYTSGSTGRPKGAQIHHGALANYIRSAVEGFELSSQDRVLQFASISFDAAAEEIYPCLATGGRLALRSKESLGAARQFLQECEQEELTVLDLPTAYWQQLVVELAAGKVELPERIRLVIIGGEKAQANSVEMWRRSVNERVVLMNTYGPTETTIVATRGALAGPGTGERATGAVVIGRSIANVETYVLDEYQRPAPLGVVGELYLGGAGVGRGYLKRAEQTAEKFVPNPYRDVVGARLYRSGDLVRRLGIGDLEFIDRVDEQVKVRGYRIELGEIRAALDEHQSVKQSVVIATDDKSGGKRIIGYVVGEAGTTPAELKKYVRERLPEYMTPEAIVVLDEMPISANGKIDRQALPIPDDVRPSLEVRYVAPQTELEQAIAAVWEELLEVSHVGIHDNFFDIGAHSLMMVQAASKLRDLVKRDLPVMKLFQYPTVSALAGFLNQGQLDSTLRRNGDSAGDHQESVAARKLGDSGRTSAPANDMALAESNGHRAASLKRPLDIAIIGMSGRFPQAPTIDVFWRNLCDAHEGISALSDSQLLTAGVDPSLLSDPRYVKAAASLDGIDLFDASFFGFSPREAEILDPQHRLFLQAAWHALESAGYVPDRFPGRIGLFAGAGFHFYLLSALRSNPEILTSGGFFQASISNEKDFLPTRVSYKLNLRGPSMAVQTACSTSLVTVHLACQSLLNGECDMALAGGVRIITPPGTGYFYEEGGVESADGHCRAFDAQASGTVGGDGLGIVVLKRLAEARADGDNILAVIKGSAVNNDGSGKVGYTAPSVDGQAQVISEAQAMAGIDPATITYVETHGTATALGDPIEIAALTQAFGAATDKTGFCAIGSVKTNIGHLDTAAGVAGLIKTALALKHRQIPASLHFKQPNPQIDFANSPFYVNTELRDWVTNGVPRRAGVSSFGIGGTNAHLILEEASEAGPSEPVDGWQVLALSARSDRALDAMATRLAAHLKQHPELNLADVAYTLQEGRKAFAYRLSVVCRDLSEAVSMLEEKGRERRLYRRVTGERATPVVFVFPGQGAQYVGMGRELYEQEPVYRSVIDRCAETMKEESGIDLRTTLYPDPPGQSGGPDLPDPPDLPGLEDAARAAELINQTGMTQMALFAVELGLARMWQSKGVQPAAMIGHSLGEYVAACLAGVISDEQAMRLVAKRGALMQHARPGVMLAVALSESELREHLRKAGSRVEVAAVNGPKQCVVSGEEDEIVEFERSLAELGIAGKRLKTSHAFHSRMMEEAVEEYGRVVAGVEWARPMISYISNVSGTWVRPEDAQTPGYWRRQMREPVRFWEGLEQIGREIKERVFLEVGPGETLSRLARQLTADRSPGGVATLGPRATDGARAVMEAVGNLWANGADIQWEKWRKGKRRRVELPGYPFEEKRYWVGGERPESELLKQKVGVENWFYVPLWKETASVIKRQERKAAQRWLIMEDKGGIGERIALELERQGCVVTRVKRAERYERRGEREYRIRQREAGDCQALLKDLERRGELPEKILHLFNLNRANDKGTLGWEERIEEAAEEGFYSLVYIAQAIGQMAGVKEAEVVVVSNGVVEVGGEEDLRAEKSMVMGPVRVMRQEYPQLRSRYIDVLIPPAGTRREEILIEQLLEDLTTESADQVIAYRGNHRWAQTYEPVRLATAPAGAGLRPEGHYLITGGLGGIGMALAEHLARSVKARLVLTGREGLPARDEWDRLMEEAGTDEKIRRKISKIRELEELGAKVEVISADVSDETQMKEVARRSRRRFGPLNGVIHAAGITNEQAIGLLQEVTPARSSSLFRPKVHGLFVLEKILRGADLDFCILFSSLSSVLGGVGFAAYSASNIFMDAFVRHHNRNSAVPWISVNWDGWRLTEKDDQQPAGPGSAQAELAMEPRDGVEAFQRIISMKMAGQVIVSTGDLEARMRRWIRLESLDGESTRNRPVQLPGHSRPELQTSYVAPRNDLERTIAAIWQDLLGIEQIGVHDNFFELGGHSLLAIQCLSRLRQAFQVEIPIRSLFENPTIVGNGEVIEEALIKEINALTEDEVLSLQEER